LGPTLIDLEASEDTIVRVVGKLVLEFQAKGIIAPLETLKDLGMGTIPAGGRG